MAFRKQQAVRPAGVTVSPKVTSAAKPSSGRNSSCRLFAQDFSLLGFEPGPQTTLKTDFQVTKGLAKSWSKNLPSGKSTERGEGRSRHLGWAGSPHSCLESVISSENRAGTDGPRLLFGNQKS